MKVVFMCFTDFSTINSGSSVRPYMIYNALKQKGYEVLLINGNKKSRREKYLRYKANNEFQNVAFCYIEPSTYPIHPMDYLILFYLKRRNIPIGIFYRDMYYKFPTLFNKKGYKRIELQLRYKIDWVLYKLFAKKIFFPTNTMSSYFRFDKKCVLPPAGEDKAIKSKRINYNLIYVGGVSERYGTPILLEALKLVNKEYRNINLHLVCREYNKDIFKDYEKEIWLKIQHVSGNDLIDIYKKSDIAIIPIRKIEYHDLAMPVKLFEYMSYGLPVIATNCKEVENFVSNNDIGIVVEDNPKCLADAIIKLYDNPIEIERLSVNVRNTLIKNNLWIHRVEVIEQQLYSTTNL